MLIAVVLILFVLAALLLLVILGAVFFAIDSFFELPYVATKKEKLETIFKFADIKKGETVIDLGSGDGRLLFKSAQLGARAIGYEINPFLVFITRIKARLLSYSASEVEKFINRGSSPRGRTVKKGTGLITIKRQDLWKANLKEADLIFVYGRKKTMQKFENFVYKNAKKGTRIIVNTNQFPTKKYLREENGVFLYKT